MASEAIMVAVSPRLLGRVTQALRRWIL